jgi:hypothetical protein
VRGAITRDPIREQREPAHDRIQQGGRTSSNPSRACNKIVEIAPPCADAGRIRARGFQTYVVPTWR